MKKPSFLAPLDKELADVLSNIFSANGLNERTVIYRPSFRVLTNSVKEALLFNQIWFWFCQAGYDKFYKFMTPAPDHYRYRPGDSWAEELCMSYDELKGAFKSLGTKITTGTSKTEALVDSLVLYWTDKERLTWYEVNLEVFGRRVLEVKSEIAGLKQEYPDYLSDLEKLLQRKTGKSPVLLFARAPAAVQKEAAKKRKLRRAVQRGTEARDLASFAGSSSSAPSTAPYLDDEYGVLSTEDAVDISEEGALTERELVRRTVAKLWNSTSPGYIDNITKTLLGEHPKGIQDWENNVRPGAQVWEVYRMVDYFKAMAQGMNLPTTSAKVKHWLDESRTCRKVSLTRKGHLVTIGVPIPERVSDAHKTIYEHLERHYPLEFQRMWDLFLTIDSIPAKEEKRHYPVIDWPEFPRYVALEVPVPRDIESNGKVMKYIAEVNYGEAMRVEYEFEAMLAEMAAL